jgi:hypothetical protein
MKILPFPHTILRMEGHPPPAHFHLRISVCDPGISVLRLEVAHAAIHERETYW